MRNIVSTHESHFCLTSTDVGFVQPSIKYISIYFDYNLTKKKKKKTTIQQILTVAWTFEQQTLVSNIFQGGSVANKGREWNRRC